MQNNDPLLFCEPIKLYFHCLPFWPGNFFNTHSHFSGPHTHSFHSPLLTLHTACCVVVVNYFSSRSAHFPAFSWSVDNCVDQHQLQHNNANQILVFSFFLSFFTAVFLILFVFSFNWFLRYLWASLWGDNCTLTPTAATTTTLSGKQQQQQHWRAITTAAAEQRTPTVRYKSTPTLLRFRLLINFGLWIPFFMDFVLILLHNFEDFPVIFFLLFFFTLSVSHFATTVPARSCAFLCRISKINNKKSKL